MTTPIACATCVFWDKLRKRDNWGRCRRINDVDPTTSKAVVTDGDLYTRDVFYCSEHSLREQPRKYSVVDAAREAARNLGKETKQ